MLPEILFIVAIITTFYFYRARRKNTFTLSKFSLLISIIIVSFVCLWTYTGRFDFFAHLDEYEGPIFFILMIILIIAGEVLVLYSFFALLFHLLGARLGLSSNEYIVWRSNRRTESNKNKKEERINRRNAIERGERAEFELFSKSSNTVQEDDDSNANRSWIIIGVIVCIGGLVSLYFDATDGTRHSESSYSSPSQSSNSYHISFHNKQLPSTYKIYKKAGTADTFVIKKDGKVQAEVRGGDSTVEIDNIIYSLPKLQ